MKLLVFHDERFIKGWLYHAFLLTEPGYITHLQNQLSNAKSEAGCDSSKRIHFTDLRLSSKDNARTRTAVKWAKLLISEIYKSSYFYLFGANQRNLDYEFFGPASNGGARDYRIYNSFFQMGLFSACRYFFKEEDRIEIVDIFSEERSRRADDPFLDDAPYKINRREANVYVGCKQVTLVAGDYSREHKYPEHVNILNFVDVIMGGFSQIIDCTSKAKGCIEVAEILFPLCQRLSENPYNVNSRYYKRCAMSFFPRYRQSRSETLKHGVLPPDNLFYHKRSLRLHQRCFDGFERFLD